MNNIVINKNNYRVKKMNAIELMALRSQIDFNNYDSVVKMYETLLEKIEVEINEKWLPVKTIGTNIYLPQGVEDDVEVVEQLISFILEHIKSVFMKSNASKKEQE